MQIMQTLRSIVEVSSFFKFFLPFLAAVFNNVCLTFDREFIKNMKNEAVKPIVEGFCDGNPFLKGACLGLIRDYFDKAMNYIRKDLNTNFCVAVKICH